VNSQVFDHTSLIRFLEARFARGRHDLLESNITPWRRAVVGDLTSAFDFKTPNRHTRLRLPATDAFKPTSLERRPDDVPTRPAHQSLPPQERGVRRARAIPYTLHADGHATHRGFHVDLRNAGDVAAVFQLRSAQESRPPRTYTVGAHDELSDVVALTAAEYDIAVHGPNGFFRSFRGTPDSGGVAVRVTTTYRHHRIQLVLENATDRRVEVLISDRYRGDNKSVSLRAGAARSRTWSLDDTHGWYDLTLTAEQDPTFRVQYAGHVENGRPSISDPLMGGLSRPTPGSDGD
jgi:phospholipase C